MTEARGHIATWRDRIRAERFRGQAFIGGDFVDAVSGETFADSSPITGEQFAEVACGDRVDVDRAVAAARRSFEDGRWSRMSPSARKQKLVRLAGLMDEARDELAAMITLDIGKPIARAAGEVSYSAENIRWIGEAVDKVYGQVAPVGPDAMATITREPVGVVGAIVPWNFPLLMAAWKIGPALAAGNSVVVKPATQSPLVTSLLARLAAEAGIPDGVLNIVPGHGAGAGEALARHIDVDALSFTGSTSVGQHIMECAAQSNLKKVSLELGGKSPTLLFADTPDLQAAAAQSAAKIFGNSGQMCDALSRVIVHESRADEFVELVAKEAAKWMPGDPFDPSSVVGTLADRRQMETFLNYAQVGADAGAELVLGGHRTLVDTGGYYAEPTVFDHVDSEMAIAREEIFGPILSVLRFSEEDEAVRIANDSEYGLTASVWSRDLATAHRAAAQIRAGAVAVNVCDGGDLTLPHGGFKKSGFGRDSSLYAIDAYTQEKAVYVHFGS